MSSLPETQHRIRQAVVRGDATGLATQLVGGGDPLARLRIHQRHYEASLVTAVVGKFPATAWLVGAPFLMAAARIFAHECPPKAPCIAEYGEDFPAFLANRPEAERVPYLRSFAELEWQVGAVSIAIERPALTADAFACLEETALPDVALDLQAGLRYLRAAWPVDDLLKLYLTNNAPNEFVFERADVWLQIRGARGAFDIRRLEPEDFVFREAISSGQSIGDAAERALAATGTFDPGRGLASLLTEGLITASRTSPQDHCS
jgi:Putative DNA-binding domain